MIYITGDKHNDFKGLFKWAAKQNLDERDTIIILGDAGINFTRDWHDYKAKKEIRKKLKCNLFVIRGNHDLRPELAIYTSYPLGWSKPWPLPLGHYEMFFGNEVLVEDNFPTIKYALDGNIYDICGKKVLVIGGAYSVDKWYRLEQGWTWHKDEQLTQEEMTAIREVYDENQVDVILSHTAPSLWEEYIKHLFMGGTKGGYSMIDKTMENWMNGFLWSKGNDLQLWYFGHYHANLNAGPIGVMLYEGIVPFGDKAPAVWDSNNYTGELLEL